MSVTLNIYSILYVFTIYIYIHIYIHIYIKLTHVLPNRNNGSEKANQQQKKPQYLVARRAVILYLAGFREGISLH